MNALKKILKLHLTKTWSIVQIQYVLKRLKETERNLKKQFVLIVITNSAVNARLNGSNIKGKNAQIF
jgi:hypothetical protein